MARVGASVWAVLVAVAVAVVLRVGGQAGATLAACWTRPLRCFLRPEDRLIAELFDWVRCHGGFVRNVEVQSTMIHSDDGPVSVRGVVATKDLCAGTPIFGIPPELIVSRAHPELGLPAGVVQQLATYERPLPGSSGPRLDETDLLTLFLMREYRKNAANVPSFWRPFTQAIKSAESSFDTPHFWSPQRLRAASPALQAEFRTLNRTHTRLFETLGRLVRAAEPPAAQGGPGREEPYTWREFVGARTAVESRTFQYKLPGCYKCVAMIPGWDMLNSRAAAVNMEFYDVDKQGHDEASCAFRPDHPYGAAFAREINNTRTTTDFQLRLSQTLPPTQSPVDSLPLLPALPQAPFVAPRSTTPPPGTRLSISEDVGQMEGGTDVASRGSKRSPLCSTPGSAERLKSSARHDPSNPCRRVGLRFEGTAPITTEAAAVCQATSVSPISSDPTVPSMGTCFLCMNEMPPSEELAISRGWQRAIFANPWDDWKMVLSSLCTGEDTSLRLGILID